MKKIEIINKEIQKTKEKLERINQRFDNMQNVFDKAEKENAIAYEKHSKSRDESSRVKWSKEFKAKCGEMRKMRRIKNKSKNKRLKEEDKLRKLQEEKEIVYNTPGWAK